MIVELSIYREDYKVSIINETQFKVSCKEMCDYIKSVCDKLEKE